MTNNYSLYVPTKVHYGRKIIEKAIETIQSGTNIMSRRILIVTTGGSLYRFGHIEMLADILNKSGDVIIFDEISANPKLKDIEKGIEIARKEKVDCVIGFGGGSSLDAAKAIAVGALLENTSITEVFRGGIEPTDRLPLIAIPTTAGTGSELSKAAILNDEERGVKGGLRGEKLYPDAAIVDSAFTDSIPFKTTMETGFDVLAHAIESYVSRKSSPFTAMLSEYAIREAGKAIQELISDLNNKSARDIMSYCSMIMGINLGNVGTALPHRMQYPIGAHSHSSHGEGLAILYPAWLKYEEKYEKDKVDKIKHLLGISNIQELLEHMELYKGMKDVDIQFEEVERMTMEVSGSIENDPASVEENVIRKIYIESWER